MADPPVKLIDRDFSDETFLFNVQQQRNSRLSDATVTSVYANNSDETFIVSLVEEGRYQVSGRASATRIASYGSYSSDPLTALAEYAARLLAHVNANQGLGWTFENTYTGRSVDGVIEEVQLIRRRGAKYEFDYNITFRAGESFMPAASLNPVTVSPSTGSLAGESLHEVEEMMMTKSQKLRTHTYTFADITNNEVEAMTGARREVTIRGNVPGSESTRKSFDDTIFSNIGDNSTVTLDSPFPGASHDVTVLTHDASREAGTTQIGKYQTEVVEGVVQ